MNLSPVQVRSPGLVEVVRSACMSAGLDPRRLELEITESVLLTGSDSTLQTLRELKAFGAESQQAGAALKALGVDARKTATD